MAEFTWVLLDAAGKELRTTESFTSQEAAEGWMGSEWAALLADGAEFVSLREGEEQVYKMGLREG